MLSPSVGTAGIACVIFLLLLQAVNAAIAKNAAIADAIILFFIVIILVFYEKAIQSCCSSQ